MISGKVEGIEAIAASEGVSDRSARMGLSLAFLAPDIVRAAVEGTLPRGFGVSRLMDMPPSWSEQRPQLESRRAIERKANTSAFRNISDWRPGTTTEAGIPALRALDFLSANDRARP